MSGVGSMDWNGEMHSECDATYEYCHPQIKPSVISSRQSHTLLVGYNVTAVPGMCVCTLLSNEEILKTMEDIRYVTDCSKVFSQTKAVHVLVQCRSIDQLGQNLV